jgi:hypothetical protein
LSKAILATNFKMIKLIITEEMTVLPEGVDLAQEESEYDGWCEN